ncbi:HDOD domain-containing protein [Desulfurivibrio sp. D14AmB]|uniref:sensor domain-containing diguanylate cyclase n=1 Tax=Desulfurivibrio sp. D14AmB TaxID=3374370 RepID=UPI00376F377D
MQDIPALLPQPKAVAAVLNRPVNELPTLPVVALKLLKLTSDVQSSSQDLARVVETDPALTAKVLRIINSAAYALPRKISSVQQAVVLLGFSTIRTLALEVTLFEQLVPARHGLAFDRIFFWRHCLSVAGLSMAFAESLGHPEPQEVYVAGLLHDIGKIILDVYGRISYREFLNNISRSEGLLVEEERTLIGLSHDEVGAFFCAEWDIPQGIILAIRFHHQRFGHLNLPADQALLVASVALANFITWTQGNGSVNLLGHPILQPEVEEIIDLERVNLQAMIRRMEQEVKSAADFYQFSFPTPEELRENMLRTNLRLARMNTRFYYAREDEHNEALSDLTRMRASLTSPHRSLDPEEIITATLTSIHRDFNFDRLYLMRIDQDSRSLQITNVLDTVASGVDLASCSLAITPLSGTLLGCLRNREPVLISGADSGETEALAKLQAREIGLVPFANNNRILGLIGMDNSRSGEPIRPSALQAVAIVANELGMALENARRFAEVSLRASIDGLTGLNNRTALDAMLAEAFAAASAAGTPLSLAMFDVDHFKKFNDRFGHQAGDSVLELLAATARKLSRPSDQVGRYGGEEFLIILNHTDHNEALHFAERLRREIEKLGVLLGKRFPDTPLTVSVGVSSLNPTVENSRQLVALADQALYRAKHDGRNRVAGQTSSKA